MYGCQVDKNGLWWLVLYVNLSRLLSPVIQSNTNLWRYFVELTKVYNQWSAMNKALSLGLSSFKVCVPLFYIKRRENVLLNSSLALKSYNKIWKVWSDCHVAGTDRVCHSGYHTAILHAIYHSSYGHEESEV